MAYKLRMQQTNTLTNEYHTERGYVKRRERAARPYEHYTSCTDPVADLEHPIRLNRLGPQTGRGTQET